MSSPTEIFDEHIRIHAPATLGVATPSWRAGRVLSNPASPVIGSGRVLSPAQEMLEGLKMAVALFPQLEKMSYRERLHAAIDTPFFEYNNRTNVFFTVNSDNQLEAQVYCGFTDLSNFSFVGLSIVHMMLAQDMAVNLGEFSVRLDVIARPKGLEHAHLARRSFKGRPFIEPMVMTPDFFNEAQMYLSQGQVLGIQGKFFRKILTPLVKSLDSENHTEQERIELASGCVLPDWASAQAYWIAGNGKTASTSS